jgi:HNH endonuclease
VTDSAASAVGNAAEHWRPAPSDPALEASDLGRIRRAATGRILRARLVQVKRTQPRLQVTYREQASWRDRRVARLVCEAFHGLPPTPQHVAMFIDGNSLNCRADNVRWATRTEVAQATVARGRHRSGKQVLAERRRCAQARSAQPD